MAKRSSIKSPKKGGRRPFKPTKTQRRQVELLTGFGLTKKQVAQAIGCGESTIERHFAEELENGHSKTLANLAQATMKRAQAPDAPASLLIFLCKTRLRFKEPRLEVDVHTNEKAGVLLAPPVMSPSEWIDMMKAADAKKPNPNDPTQPPPDTNGVTIR